MNKDAITRLEIIDEEGRQYVNNNCIITDLSFQDQDRTLKIFLKNNPGQPNNK